MKKGIIVLLITVLVAGFAFAGTLKGSAAIEFGVDLDNETWGFDNSESTKYCFKFEFDTTKVAVGEDHKTDIWAELAAEATAYVGIDQISKTAPYAFGSYWNADVTTAKIHVGEVTFDILGAGKSVDWAKAYWKKSGSNYSLLTAQKASTGVGGFGVAYDGYNAGFAAAGDYGADTYEIFAHAETKAFKFAEDQVSAQAAVWTKLTDATQAFGGSVKAGYAADKFTADVAADFAYASDKFVPEIAASAKYDFVSAYLYVAPYDTAELDIDAKVAANYTVEADDVTVEVAGSVDARKVTHDTREITIAAEETCTIDAIEIAASEEYAIFAKTLDLEVEATYTADAFEAYVGFGFGFDFNASDALTSLPIWAGISSTKVVENATLALEYDGLDVIANTKGAITASATISF